MKNIQILNTKKYKAFTLVELIVVIVILSILATVAFISFKDYSSQSRDSVRLSDITNISKGLELFQIKVGTYPTPVNSTTYTGGISGGNILSQGTLNGNLIGLSKSNPTDPLTNIAYTYSTSGNSSYYQIYSELENISSFNSDSINSVYAASSKQVLIKGNYLFDPSLPSLLVIPGSVSSSSGIFSPNVCFVTNGNSGSGSNLLSISTSTNCTKKSSLDLNSLDSSLVGYWDMETLTGTLLKDLSGNKNNGLGTGGIIIGGTGGILGKGTYFDGVNKYLTINDAQNLNFGTGTNFSIVVISNSYKGISTAQTERSVILQKGYDDIGYPFSGGGYFLERNQYGNFRGAWGRWNTGGWGGGIKDSNVFINNYFYGVLIFDRNTGNSRLYTNGLLQTTKSLTSTDNFSSNQNMTIGGDFENNSLMIGPSLFNGIIDDIKIYNRVLSDKEILQQAKVVGF